MTSSGKYDPLFERRTRELGIRGTRYAISEWGSEENPAVFYLHGWGDCAATFQFVADVICDRFHVIAPDWRGFGDTGWNQSSYWFPDYVADLHDLLHELSPEQPVMLVGHSMGANVGGLYAGSFPERIEAFVNIEGFGLMDSDPLDAPARYRRWVEMSRAGPAFADYASFDELAARVQKRAPGIDDARASFVANAWALEEDGRVRLRSDPRHKLPNPVLYRRAESEACWGVVTAPVLLVTGEQSEFASPGLPFPDARVATVEGAGHMMHMEAPAALATVITGFLEQYL